MEKDTCNIPKEEKKAEAIAYMKAMDINAEDIRLFEKQDYIPVYEDKKTEADDANRLALLKQAEQFEKTHHTLVYAVIRTHTDFGLIDHLLFVSDHKEDWELDRENAKCLIPMVYAINHDNPMCSEFGSIPIRVNKSGFPVRFFR